MPPHIFSIRGCPIRAGVRTGSVGTLPISVSSSGQGWAGVGRGGGDREEGEGVGALRAV